jgi:hypothetical protein
MFAHSKKMTATIAPRPGEMRESRIHHLDGHGHSQGYLVPIPRGSPQLAITDTRDGAGRLVSFLAFLVSRCRVMYRLD